MSAVYLNTTKDNLLYPSHGKLFTFLSFQLKPNGSPDMGVDRQQTPKRTTTLRFALPALLHLSNSYNEI
jgi:hypothetical protein